MPNAIANRVRPGVYHIAFDTESTPGHIRAVKVTIEADMLPDDSAIDPDFQAKYDIGLCEHPLYQHLRQYCLNNRG